MLCSGSIFAQAPQTAANISGTITNASNGNSVPFINIVIKGSNTGTASNMDGSFELNNLDEGSYTLVITGVGYESQEVRVKVTPNTTIALEIQLNEKATGLNGVVVSADRSEINRREAPVVVSSIPSKRFEATQSQCIAEGLDFTPGIRMENNCSNCGFSQVRMNGLDGPYSQILINSRPVFSGLAGVYGLELIPASMVDRIEVVRGGGSALFGGNAIAGTINIITKEPDENTFSIGTNYGVIGVGHGTKTAIDHTTNISGSVLTEDNKSGIFFYSYIRNREPFDEDNDGFSEIVSAKNTTLGFNAYHKPNKKSKIGLDYYRINEFRRGGNMFDYLPHEADITEQVEHMINGVSLTYDLFTNKKFDKLSVYASAQTVDRASYYGAMQDPDAYGQTNDLTSSIGAHYNKSIEKFIYAPATLIIGIDNNYNILKDAKLGANGNPNTLLTHQFVNTLGSFVQNEWKTMKTKLALGLRYDTYIIKDISNSHEHKADDISGNVFAPRGNFLWNISKSFRYRISYAKGYRAPQLFDEDLHTEATGSRVILHKNSESLKQETSHSFTTSLNKDFQIGNSEIEVLVEGFYTILQNPFANEMTETDEEGVYEYTRINAEDGAYVTGANIEINGEFTNDILMQIGFTMQKSRYESAQFWGEEESSKSRNFVRTPDRYGYITLEWEASKRFSSSMTATYTGPMYIPHFGLDPNTTDADEISAIENGDVITGERLERSEEFLHIGFKVNYELPLGKSCIEFSLGIENIFNQNQKNLDRGLYRDAGYIYGPSQPRTLNFGLKYHI